MSLDPSLNSSQLAALVARCDYGQFEVYTVTPTPLLDANHPHQAMFSLKIGQPTLNESVMFVATYRGRKIMGPMLIAPTTQDALANAAVLDHANNVLDLLDLQAGRDGANPNTYAPT